MTTSEKLTEQLNASYKEESVKPAMMAAVVAMLLVGLPLGYMIYKIGNEGTRATDTSRYNNLAALLDGNINSIRKTLISHTVADKALSGVGAAPVVTLITPDLAPGYRDEAQDGKNALDVKLKAIYWNPRDPLVTIDDENYRVGDRVKGYKIKEIRKTEVVFLSPIGDTVIKYFYDYLDTPTRK